MMLLDNSRWRYFCEVCLEQPGTIHATEAGFFCGEHCPYLHDGRGECRLQFRSHELRSKYEQSYR